MCFDFILQPTEKIQTVSYLQSIRDIPVLGRECRERSSQLSELVCRRRIPNISNRLEPGRLFANMTYPVLSIFPSKYFKLRTNQQGIVELASSWLLLTFVNSDSIISPLNFFMNPAPTFM
jgi:hypothetical protein